MALRNLFVVLEGRMMRILQADAFEYLPGLQSNSVDLIITDPPYNFTLTQQLDLHNEFMRITKTGIIVFAPPENQWVPLAGQILFWVKPISTKNTSRRYSRFVEMIFLYGDLKWNTGMHWSQYVNVFHDLVDDAKLHPYRKPPSLITRLILLHTDPGDTILDPFAGSGVVAEVGERLGRTVFVSDIA